jgi:hypothetical protein
MFGSVVGSRVGAVEGSRTGTGISSAGCARCFYFLRSRVVGLRVTGDSQTVAMGELGSVQSPDVGVRRRHGFRGGFEGYGWCGRLRANFLARPGERTEFFRHRERFPSNFVIMYFMEKITPKRCAKIKKTIVVQITHISHDISYYLSQ